jgi:hypothetical protein
MNTTDQKTSAALSELVNAAYRLMGGKKRTDAIILRPLRKKQIKPIEKPKDEDFFYMSGAFS